MSVAIIGYLTIAVFVAGLLALPLQLWRATPPMHPTLGLRVRMMPGALMAWAGLAKAVAEIHADVGRGLGPDPWIELIPRGGLARSDFVPDGMMGTHRCIGTVRCEAYCLGLAKRWVLVIVQERDDGYSLVTREWSRLLAYRLTGHWPVADAVEFEWIKEEKQ